MADLFESYAAEFAQLQHSVEARLAGDVAKMSADMRRAVLQHALSEVDEASELLSQMEIEVQGFPQSVRDRYAGQLQGKRAAIAGLQRAVERAKQPASGATGSGLDLESYTDEDRDEAHAQRERLLQGTSLLERGTERLTASTRLALQTEDVGAGILNDLQSQREQIEHSRDTLHGAGAYVDRSSRTLSQMIRRARQQKVVTAAIIVVLVLLILLILYAKIVG
ncbi:t-SNARE VTI1 [Malassezia sp. CBS 17886]|nr:t-SNARE VTI1 [Malassezia sp. CBS 17886]